MVATAAVSLVLVGCADRVNAPTAVRPGAPSFEIRDGAHNSGNPHFYFLPPIVASPNATGGFDATQAPSVTVCLLAGSDCGPVVAQFSMTAGTGSAVVRLDATNQLYVVNWQTDQCVTGPCTLPSGNVYRVRVLVAGTELGHADVQVVASQQEAKNVNTGEFFPLVDGRTVPVKFRVEQGAVFFAGPSTQPLMIQTPVSAAGSSVQLVIPAGALSQPTGITVLPAIFPSGTSTSALVGGTAYDFGPTGTMFASPVMVSMQYNPANIPAGSAERMLRLFMLVNGVWQLVPGSRVDPVMHTVTAMTSHFSTYGVNASATVSGGGMFSCGMGTSGTPVCWGDNGIGELGNGALGNGSMISSTPVVVSTGAALTAVSTGGFHACGVDGSHKVYCWGSNSRGELGDGTTMGPQQCSGGQAPCSTTPAAITGVGIDTFVTVSAGMFSSCAVSFAGTAFCWGDNQLGELGNGSTTSSPTPTPVVSPQGVSFVSVSLTNTFAGDSTWHTCALASDGSAYCWGDDAFGELGSGTSQNQTCVNSGVVGPCSTIPIAVAGGISFRAISSGGDFTCGVDGLGSVYCWGANGVGQLGNGTTTGPQQCVGNSTSGPAACSPTPTPVLIPAGDTVVAVTAGGAHACALTTMGLVFCWGANFAGQLGNGTTTSTATPTLVSVPAGTSFTLVSAGGYHTCGIANTTTTPNTAYCWGANGSGQLGNGTTVDQLTPVAVSTIP